MVGSMIPLAPGSAGTTQLAMLIALGAFLPPTVVHTSGVAWANVQWLVLVVQQIAFGLFFMLRSHVSFLDITGELGDPSGRPEAGGGPRSGSATNTDSMT
jgi:hypothetical protein